MHEKCIANLNIKYVVIPVVERENNPWKPNPLMFEQNKQNPESRIRKTELYNPNAKFES